MAAVKLLARLGAGDAVSRAGTQQLLFPAIADFPMPAALFVAVLPIHDANGLLLTEMRRAPIPPDIWACVIADDPFRRPVDLLRQLRDAGAARLCCFPLSRLHGPDQSRFFESGGAGMLAERRMAEAAQAMGFEVADFSGEILDLAARLDPAA
nr:hypothetical protein [Sphingomonas sp. Y57]